MLKKSENHLIAAYRVLCVCVVTTQIFQACVTWITEPVRSLHLMI